MTTKQRAKLYDKLADRAHAAARYFAYKRVATEDAEKAAMYKEFETEAVLDAAEFWSKSATLYFELAKFSAKEYERVELAQEV